MSMRSMAAWPTAVAALVLAATAVAVPSAHAADEDDYRLTLTSSSDTTDFGHRTVDLSGTLTRPDGTPAADAPVRLQASLLFNTWNPWGDPIDPITGEGRDLGTVRTDANGRFVLEDVPADRVPSTPGRTLFPRHEVVFYASHDADPADPGYVSADTTVNVQAESSTLTYQVNKRKVREGEYLIVTGKVAWPAGLGPVAGTRVLLRTYFENAYNAQTTTDASGNFMLRAKIDRDDNEFVVFSSPTDYYIAGEGHTLPVENVTP
ncbi:acyl carrier protein [Streptomyces sp. NPDC088387]|uniref:acyl carrier protein n=1 Tax=Streptomyces sp. NPDC088387 TaxID=3365859 RepID=UPI00380ACEB3